MNGLKEGLITLMTSSLTIAMIGIMTPEGIMKQSVKSLCGLVLAVIMLSPLASLRDEIGNLFPGYEENTDSNNEKAIYNQLIESQTALLEQALIDQIESEWGLASVRITLEVDASNPSGIVIRQALITTTSQMEKKRMLQLEQAMEEMLECEVSIHAAD